MKIRSCAHNRSLTFATLALALGGALLSAGCSRVPTEQVEAARQSVQQAREAGAEQYAAQELAHAQQAIADLEGELEAQGRRIALSRNYDRTAELTETAKDAGETALSVATQARELAKVEAQMSLEDARVALDKARVSLDSAPTSQGGRKALEPLRSELTLLQTSFSELQSSYDAGDYLHTKPKAEETKKSAERIGAEIAKAIEAAKKKPARVRT